MEAVNDPDPLLAAPRGQLTAEPDPLERPELPGAEGADERARLLVLAEEPSAPREAQEVRSEPGPNQPPDDLEELGLGAAALEGADDEEDPVAHPALPGLRTPPPPGSAAPGILPRSAAIQPERNPLP